MPTTDAPAEDLSPASIQTRLKKLDDAKNVEESVREGLVATYKKILLQLKSAEDFASQAGMINKAIQDAPEQLRQLKTPAPAVTTVKPVVPPDMTLPQMQAALSDAEKQQAQLQKKLAELQVEPNRRADRRVEVPRLQDLARKQLQEVTAQLAIKPVPDENTEVPQANRLLLEARKRSLSQELLYYEAELRGYEALGDLLTARRDQAVVQAAQADQAVKTWQSAVNDRRRIESEQQARDARKATLLANPAIKRLTQESAELTSQRQQLASNIERVTQESDAREKQLLDLDAQFAKVLDRVKRVGLTEAIGLLLRKQREDLPHVSEHKRDIELRQADISKANLQLVELEDQRGQLADIDSQVKLILKQVQDANPRLDTTLYEDDIRQALLVQRGYLDSLITDTNSYLDKLVELDTRDRQLIAKSNEYSDFSSEHILWIRSADLPKPADVHQLLMALRWLGNSGSWTAMWATFRTDLKSTPSFYVISLLVLVVLFGGRRRWFRRLRETGTDAAKGRSASFQPTAIALLVTALLSVAWPTLIWLLGFRLSRISAGHEFIEATGQALRALAPLTLTLEVAHNISRHKGLAEAHFNWPSAVIQKIRSSVRWLLGLGLPAAFIVLLTEAQSNEPVKHTLGRLAFVLSQFLLAIIVYQLWSAAPRGVEAWWSRHRGYLQLAGAAVFIALAGLAFAGYYYTAVQFEERLFSSVWLILILLLVQASTIRWLLLAYRELAIRRLRERRAAEVAAASGSTVPSEVVASEPLAKLSDIDVQTRNILNMVLIAALLVGLLVIWGEILPALKILRRVELWPRPFTILDTFGPAVIAPGTLTLSDGLLAIVIGGLTFACARNIPGLLEVTVLRKLTLDAGERFAVTTVCRYLISLAGIVLVFAQLGIGWSQVQWLVAGMSLGLGFGLQEIFANFVSGLVLLFERPIRIGDIVTVGDITGKVSRIRIRATTITDWDLREIVIPNKEFITGKVMNWTLSDTVSRMTIQISLSTDTDPEVARQLLLQVAQDQPLVLKEPPPHALFDEFGDNSLNFTLRVYMSSRDVYIDLRHSLNSALRAAFRNATITSSIPQFDLNIRSVPDALRRPDNQETKA